MRLKSRFPDIYPVLLVMIPTVISLVYIVQPYFHWQDDAGLYIMQAKCLVYGTPLETLYESNKFMEQHSIKIQGPHLYPMGTPILLSLVIYFFGSSFLAMKIMSAIFLIATIPVLYHIFLKYTKDRFISIFGLFLIYPNFHIVNMADTVLSDIPFMFFSFLSLHFMKERINALLGISLGLLIFASYINRDTGIFLLPGLFVKQIVDFRYSGQDKNIRTEILPYVVFSILFCILKILIPYGNENFYQNLLVNVSSTEFFLNNLYYYRVQFGRFFMDGNMNHVLKIFIFCLISTGLFSHWKKSPHLIVYTFLVALILMFWNRNGVRLMLPIIPILILYAILGYQGISRLFSYAKIVSYPLAAAILAFVVYQNVDRLHDYRVKSLDRYLIQSTDYTLDYIGKNITDSDIIGFRCPRALTMLTGKKSIYTDLRNFDSSVARFLLIRDSSYTSGKYQKYRDTLLSGEYVLLEKKVDHASSDSIGQYGHKVPLVRQTETVSVTEKADNVQ